MSKLEDIKKRHTAGYVTKYANPLEIVSDYNNDVVYLLSLIEVAEKALKLSGRYATSAIDKDYLFTDTFKKSLSEINMLSNESLQQLHK